ncbi:Enterobactin exporter EntS [Candidatus Lokiarchaeum ossiferum]|uniref:Enterobactin exporter EntS n=1 Tax=Candidatus Lokiarchaeum ossiferum TaxID=2951803 RepID=A0ABY6HP86_9ARCH|nr:Enterobactin exporter EntS [Candidatus Lokiarchaeum sp. B-35]
MIKNSPDLDSNQYNLKGYISIFTSQQFSIFGSAIVQFALIWWLSTAYTETLVLSLATMAGLLPTILIAPFAGVICDRWNRKKILLLTDSFQALSTLALILLFWFNVVELYHIYILLGIRGLMQGLQMPAGISVMSSMVPSDKITKFNSLNSMLQALSYLLSPAFGAIAVSNFDIATIYWLDVFTFIPAAIVLLKVSIPSLPKSLNEKSKINFIGDIKESLIYLMEKKLFWLILFFALANIFINPLFSLLPKLISDFYQASAYFYSFLMIIVHVGYIVATILIMQKKNYIPTIKSIVVNCFGLSITTLLLYFIPSNGKWLFYPLGALVGFFIALVDVQFMSLLQVVIPKEMQGRIFSTFFTLIKSLLPLALILWGVVADSLSIHSIYLLSPVISLILMVLLTLFTPLLKLKFESSAIPDDEPKPMEELASNS